MVTNVRDVRPTFPLAGIGGFLEVEWVTNSMGKAGAKPREGDKLEIERWQINHKFRTVTLPLSGGKGATTARRVADGFTFVAIVAFDLAAARAGPPDNTFAAQAFVDGRLEGNSLEVANFHFGLRLQCGDPSFVATDSTAPIANQNIRGSHGLYYFCPRVILTEAETFNNPKGDPPEGIVMATVRGEGAAPLERYLGVTRIARGGLGFDQD